MFSRSYNLYSVAAACLEISVELLSIKLSIAPTGLPDALASFLLIAFLDTGTWASGLEPEPLVVPASAVSSPRFK